MKTNRCAKQIFSGWHSHNCQRSGTIEEGGKMWCCQHAPSKVAARNSAREAKWSRESAARSLLCKAQNLRRSIVDELLKLDHENIPLEIRSQVDELRELEASK